MLPVLIREGTVVLRSRVVSTSNTNIDSTPHSRSSTDARGIIGAFTEDRSGSIAIVFALMAVITTSLIGGAIDFGRAYSMKARLQQAVDTASLAAASKYINDPERDIEAAIAAGERFFRSSMLKAPSAAMTSSLDPVTSKRST